jgi:hypothetical protein
MTLSAAPFGQQFSNIQFAFGVKACPAGKAPARSSFMEPIKGQSPISPSSENVAIFRTLRTLGSPSSHKSYQGAES